jgi:hypothetical protein
MSVSTQPNAQDLHAAMREKVDFCVTTFFPLCDGSTIPDAAQQGLVNYISKHLTAILPTNQEDKALEKCLRECAGLVEEYSCHTRSIEVCCECEAVLNRAKELLNRRPKEVSK